MNTISSIKNQNLIKTIYKKKKIQRNRKIITMCILLLTLFIIGTSIKNMYVSSKSSNLIYSVDYYFTHWKDKSLRLIEVESMSVISHIDNKIEIEAFGLSYEKPYKKTYLIGTFSQDNKGCWKMESVKIKNENFNIEKENSDISP